jgi:enoyl-CoA hydratase/carnithine racemase
LGRFQLIDVIGLQKAEWLMLRKEPFDGKTAQQIGLADSVEL